MYRGGLPLVLAATATGRKGIAKVSGSSRPFAAQIWQGERHSLGTFATAAEAALERLPILTWLPTYTAELLYRDLIGGFTIAVVLLPQGVAYAMLCELPPIYGLYAALAPSVVYAVLGTSRHLAIGPFALVSLLVADTVSPIVDPATPEYVPAVMTVSLMVGLLQLLMAGLSLDVLVNFISDSVLSGFTTAAALLIASSQLKHILGLVIPRLVPSEKVVYIYRHWEEINPTALACGLLGIAMLKITKWANKRFCSKVLVPEQLLLLLVATAICTVFRLDEAPSSLFVLGEIETGIPQPGKQLGRFVGFADSDVVFELLRPALVVAVFSFILSASIVRNFSLMHEYKVDMNQELVALGLANVVGSIFTAYPASGSLSRSALVEATCGSRCTQLHGMISSALILLVLLFLTPLFQKLPKAVLASIVFMAIVSLFQVSRLRFLLKVNKSDGLLWLVAFVGTTMLGVQGGLAIAIIASLVALVIPSIRPIHAVLGRLPHSQVFCDLSTPDATRLHGVAIFAFEAPLHFANKDVFYSAVLQAISSHELAAKQGDLSLYRPVDRAVGTPPRRPRRSPSSSPSPRPKETSSAPSTLNELEVQGLRASSATRQLFEGALSTGGGSSAGNRGAVNGSPRAERSVEATAASAVSRGQWLRGGGGVEEDPDLESIVESAQGATALDAPALSIVLLEFGSVNGVDATALRMLQAYICRLTRLAPQHAPRFLSPPTAGVRCLRRRTFARSYSSAGSCCCSRAARAARATCWSGRASWSRSARRTSFPFCLRRCSTACASTRTGWARTAWTAPGHGRSPARTRSPRSRASAIAGCATARSPRRRHASCCNFGILIDERFHSAARPQRLKPYSAFPLRGGASAPVASAEARHVPR